MLLDVIASRRSRRVVLTHRVMPSLASRRVASRRVVSPHASLCQSCRRRCIVAASPHLSLRCRLSRYIVAASSSPIAPLFLVGCCVCPLSYSPLPALRRIVSPHASRRRRLTSPVASLRRIMLVRRIVAVSRVALCPHRLAVAISCVASLCLPSHVSSSVVPSSSRRIIAALPHLSLPVVVVALVRVRYPLR